MIIHKILLFVSLFSHIIAVEPSVFDMEPKEENLAPQISNEEKIEQVFYNNLFLSIEKIPDKVFVNQIFSLELKATKDAQVDGELKLEIPNNLEFEVINPDSKWEKISDSIYTNRLYLKLKNINATLPKISLQLLQNSQVIESTILNLPTPKVLKLSLDDKFSSVLANSLIVKKSKTSRFDNENLIMILEIESSFGNLRDFSVKNVKKEGIDSSSNTFPDETIYYFAIFDNHKKSINFSYYNLVSNSYKFIEIPVLVEEDEVSTQVGLNPKESPYEYYKKIAIYILAVLFLIIFIFRRKKLYFFILFILIAYIIYSQNLFSKAHIKAKTQMRILPTENSTIFYITEEKQEVEKLGSRGNFIKVLLPNKKIGWVEKDDILKN